MRTEPDDQLWSAIAEPSRRRVLDLLVSGGEATASVLAEQVPFTRQAVSKHLVDLDEWTAARNELLVLEKELTRRSDELAQRRRGLPWARINKEYTLQTAAGPRTLAQLFEGRSQLVMYNFMFGPDYEAGCPVCSS